MPPKAESTPGEQAHIDSLISQLRAKMERDYGAGRMQRDAHPKMHGCVRAEFVVDANLPPELAIGIFREPRSYPAWARLSNGSGEAAADYKGDVRGIAVKLMGVEGEKLLPRDPHGTTHDLILISISRFITRDIGEFDGLVTAIVGGPLHVSWFMLTHPQVAVKLRGSLKRFSNPLNIRYFSVLPFLLGSRAVKYCLTPRIPDRAVPQADPGYNYLKDAMVATLATPASGDAVFDFGIQFQTDERTMPIEDASVDWDEAVSPFHKVGTLTIPAQVFDTPERREFGDNLSFDPWRCLPEHRPLGGINRARLQVYEALSKFRFRRNEVPQAEPDA